MKRTGARGATYPHWSLNILSPLCKTSSIQAAVLDGLGNVGRENRVALGEIGDGSRNLQDAVVRPRRKPQLVHRKLDQSFGVGINRAVFLQKLRLQMSVTVDPLFLVSLRL